MAVPFVPPEHVSCGVGDVRAVFARVLPHPDVLAVDVVSDDVLLRRVLAAHPADVVIGGLVARHVVLAVVRVRRWKCQFFSRFAKFHPRRTAVATACEEDHEP